MFVDTLLVHTGVELMGDSECIILQVLRNLDDPRQVSDQTHQIEPTTKQSLSVLRKLHRDLQT